MNEILQYNNKEAILDVFSFEKTPAKGPIVIEVMVVVHSPIDAVLELEFHSSSRLPYTVLATLISFIQPSL